MTIKSLPTIGSTAGFKKEGYGFLSNMIDCDGITLDSVNYPSVEAAYQAAKTTSLELRKPFEQMSSWDAKKAGKALPLRSDWNEIRIRIMKELLLQKFDPANNPDLHEKLLQTGGAEIVEGNFWGDVFWGFSIQKGTGENHLGKLLMEVRTEYRWKALMEQVQQSELAPWEESA